ncbi:hypothetical protein RGUI_1474 [Rhodovulum sp. P5]|uniref:heme NO-binding domain-containing protein n=1 Tax=Rhodovulum sp. P5 TaxID=1564506 RepID=UPI0009C2DC2C|nr:heme NO-binding domain-containing protein [Rhodovulum sp. P5]ARE39615.1 hypothetical protein RGUI_1474 [Rhodovulum sp. P5]
MHGLVNRAIQYFISTTYGPELWDRIARDAGAESRGFSALLNYSDAMTGALISSAAESLNQPRSMLLEDLGTFLVSDPSLEPLRRLLRFGGETFSDFIYSLEDFPERLRLIVPDFPVPELELQEDGGGSFLLRSRNGMECCIHVMEGMLRAIADDYGALVLLEVEEAHADGGLLRINLLDVKFSEGRAFSLSGTLA